jgi:two-component system cell cycle sensor histidine kinase PleC
MIYPTQGRARPLLLVVDDDDLQRQLYRDTLDASGFDVIETADGSQGLAAFKDARPDLILLDVLMPGIDGYETCRAIRADAIGSTVPILMATGLDDIEAIERSYDAGATDFIAKPMNWALLPHRVRYALRAHDLLNDVRISEHRLAQAHRIASLGNFVFRPSDRTFAWSAEAARILGHEDGTAPNDVRSMLRCIPGPERLGVVRAFRQLWASGAVELDHQIMLPGGGAKHVSLWVERIDDERGGSFLQGTFQDISNRKEIELSLRKARDAANAASEAKSRFLATVSHELRTPLNGVIGFSEIIAEQFFGPQTRYREYAENILLSGRHMLDLVNNILNVAKLETGGYEIEVEPIDLRAAVETAVGMFRGTKHAEGRTIAIPADAPWPWIDADHRAIQQMLLNLLSNAAKFSEPGTPIEMGCHICADGEIVLTVTDHGIGMTPQEATNAVQLFYQADTGHARKYDGIGIGLSIVSGLMACHRGRLAIDSTVGIGSRISLVFPASAVCADTLVEVA